LKRNAFAVAKCESRTAQNHRETSVLKISQQQMKCLQQVMLDRFERRLLAHIEQYFPTHWRVVGAEQMAEVVRFGVHRARELGCHTERDGYLLHSLMLYLGSHFDTDPQYPWLGSVLADETIASRSERLANAHDAAMEFLDSVAGPQGELMATALQRLQSTLIPELRREREANFGYLLHSLKLAWPQKVDRVGEQGLRALAQSVMPAAQRIGMRSSPNACLYVVACFFFGHGLARDPQFPWAGRLLSKTTLANGSAQSFADQFDAHLRALEA
jgi:hypothetical protein